MSRVPAPALLTMASLRVSISSYAADSFRVAFPAVSEELAGNAHRPFNANSGFAQAVQLDAEPVQLRHGASHERQTPSGLAKVPLSAQPATQVPRSSRRYGWAELTAQDVHALALRGMEHPEHWASQRAQLTEPSSGAKPSGHDFKQAPR